MIKLLLLITPIIALEHKISIGSKDVFIQPGEYNRQEFLKEVSGDLSSYGGFSVDHKSIKSTYPFEIKSDILNATSVEESSHIISFPWNFHITVPGKPHIPSNYKTMIAKTYRGKCDSVAQLMQLDAPHLTILCDRKNRKIVIHHPNLLRQYISYTETPTHIRCKATINGKTYEYDGRVNGLRNNFKSEFRLPFRNNLDKSTSVDLPRSVQVESDCLRPVTCTDNIVEWRSPGYYPFIKTKPNLIVDLPLKLSNMVAGKQKNYSNLVI